MGQHLDLEIKVAGAAVGSRLTAQAHLRAGAHTARDARLHSLAVLPLEGARRAVERLLQRHLDGMLLIERLRLRRAAGHFGEWVTGIAAAKAAARAAPAAHGPEERLKEIGKAAATARAAAEHLLKLLGRDAAILAPTAGLAAPLVPVEVFRPAAGARELLPFRAEAVVLAALVLVGQHFIGLVDVLKLLFRGLVPLIYVRVILPRQFAIGLFDFIGAGVLLHAQRFIVVLVFHRAYCPQAISPAESQIDTFGIRCTMRPRRGASSGYIMLPASQNLVRTNKAQVGWAARIP